MSRPQSKQRKKPEFVYFERGSMNQVIYVLTFAPTPFNGALTWLTNCHTPFVFLHFVHPGPGPGLVRPLEEVVRCNAIGKSVSNNSLE